MAARTAKEEDEGRYDLTTLLFEQTRDLKSNSPHSTSNRRNDSLPLPRSTRQVSQSVSFQSQHTTW